MTRPILESARGQRRGDDRAGSPSSADQVPAREHVDPLDAVLGATQERWGRPLARFDPADGGARAEMLLLRRDPRCRVRMDPVVSLDSGHPADTNLRAAVATAGVPRHRLAVWHLVPWWLEDPDGPPRAQAWAEAVELAGKVWPLLRELRAVVLLGGDAQRAWGRFAPLAPGVDVFAAPHPSPLAWHRRSPDGVRNGEVVARVLREAAAAQPGR